MCLPGGEGTQWSDCHCVRSSIPAHVFKGHRQRTVFIQHVIGHHHGKSSRHTEIGHEADEQRGHNADRNGPLWVLHLLSYRTRAAGSINTHSKPSSEAFYSSVLWGLARLKRIWITIRSYFFTALMFILQHKTDWKENQSQAADECIEQV